MGKATKQTARNKERSMREQLEAVKLQNKEAAESASKDEHSKLDSDIAKAIVTRASKAMRNVAVGEETQQTASEQAVFALYLYAQADLPIPSEVKTFFVMDGQSIDGREERALKNQYYEAVAFTVYGLGDDRTLAQTALLKRACNIVYMLASFKDKDVVKESPKTGRILVKQIRKSKSGALEVSKHDVYEPFHLTNLTSLANSFARSKVEGQIIEDDKDSSTTRDNKRNATGDASITADDVFIGGISGKAILEGSIKWAEVSETAIDLLSKLFLDYTAHSAQKVVTQPVNENETKAA